MRSRIPVVPPKCLGEYWLEVHLESPHALIAVYLYERLALFLQYRLQNRHYALLV